MLPLFSLIRVNKTPAETFPKFPLVLRVMDTSDRNPPLTATNVTFRPSLRQASELWLVDFDPICRWLVYDWRKFWKRFRVFCFRNSRINENGGNSSLVKFYRVSRDFCIRKFFYADIPSVHTCPPNTLGVSGDFCVRSPEWKLLYTLDAVYPDTC